MQKNCTEYARNMLKYAGNMQIYAKTMQVQPIICKKYARNMQIYRLYKSNMQKIGSENMQKYAVLYATYAGVYRLHILHLYAPPSLLMARCRRASQCGYSLGRCGPGRPLQREDSVTGRLPEMHNPRPSGQLTRSRSLARG